MSRFAIKRLVRDIVSLGAIQAAVIAAPFVVLALVARGYGSDGVASFAFATALFQLAVMLVDYGFPLSATRQVAQLEESQEGIQGLFNAVTLIRLAISIPAGLAFAISVTLLPLTEHIADVVAFASLALPMHALFPAWLYAGKRQFSELLLIQAVSRAVTVCLALTVWRLEGSLGALFIASTASNVLPSIVRRLLGHGGDTRVSLREFRLARARRVLGDATPLFLSNVCIASYTTAVPLVVGLYTAPTQLAAFHIAERVLKVAQAAFGPVTQALYPRFARVYAGDPGTTRRVFVSAALVYFSIGAAVSSVLWLGADLLVGLVSGGADPISADALRCFAGVPLFVAASTLLGTLTLLPMGRARAFTVVVSIGGIAGLFLVAVGSIHAGAKGAALAYVAVEAVVAAGMGLAVLRYWGRA